MRCDGCRTELEHNFLLTLAGSALWATSALLIYFMVYCTTLPHGHGVAPGMAAFFTFVGTAVGGLVCFIRGRGWFEDW